MEAQIENNTKIFWINVFGFFLALHYAVISYSGSFFLSGLIQQKNIWIIYTIASFFAIFLNLGATRILKNISFDKLTRFTIILAIINTFMLASSKTILMVSLQFMFYFILSGFLFTLASIALEEFSKDTKSGSIRGSYNAITNGGYLLAPFISSFFIGTVGINSIFILSSVFSVISIFIFQFFISPTPRLPLQKENIRSGLRKVLNNYDLKYITLGQIGITTFYACMAIYIPFKLQSVGISLTQYLSILLPFALSPFLFMPPLLGHLEDAMKDEKEILILSYFGLIGVLIFIALCESHSIFVWAITLFFSRICASSAETSTNSYLFKKINTSDTVIISLFQSCDYIPYLIFTPIFAILVNIADLKTLYLSVSFFLCFVLVYLSKLHDTKNYEKHKIWRDIWTRSKKRSKTRSA